MALPGPNPIVQRQMQQRQHSVVDLVGIEVHRCSSPADRDRHGRQHSASTLSIG